MNQVKVIDCSIRDGGLINKWNFNGKIVRDLYLALSQAGIDYMEIGYRASKKIYLPSNFGMWKFCDEDDVKRTLDGIDKKTKLSMMVDVGEFDNNDILLCKDSAFHLVRIATYLKDIDKAIYSANKISEKGYEVMINIMAASKCEKYMLIKALEKIQRETNVLCVYLVDSFGAFYTDQVAEYATLYKSILKNIEVGIHTHNNQQLAFANTITALNNGVKYLDSTVLGIGRAAGNCPLELLIPYLNNPKYNIEPVLDVIWTTFKDLKQELDWGYSIPTALTGILNLHPVKSFKYGYDKREYHFNKLYMDLIRN